MNRFLIVGLGMTVWIAGTEASAQRRTGKKVGTSVEVVFKKSVQFGDTHVRARTYQVHAAGDTITLSNPKTKVRAATLKATPSDAKVSLPKPKAWVEIKKKDATLVYQHLTSRLEVKGILQKKANKKSLAGKVGKDEQTIKMKEQEEVSFSDVVAQSLKRYENGVSHCGEQAQKSRWRGDDPRFRRCVCPIAEMWRLPKAPEPVWTHRWLEKNRNGYSIQVNEKGRVSGCETWVGSKQPE